VYRWVQDVGGGGIQGRSLWEIFSKNAEHSLGKYATVFQVEIFAILAYAHEIQMHPRPEKYVSIGCDS
jgi:hypothetical protein